MKMAVTELYLFWSPRLLDFWRDSLKSPRLLFILVMCDGSHGLHPRAVPQPREDDVLTQMDFALFGGALGLLGQHSHLLDYSPEHPRECQDSPGARQHSEKHPRLSWRFEIPRGARRVSREQSSHEQTCSILCSLSVLGTATALAGWAKALPAAESQDSPRAQKTPPEAAAKGEFTALEEPKNTAQTDHLWIHTFHCLGWKCLLPPSISLSELLAFSCWDLI